MFDVAVEQIVKVKPPKTAVVYKALLIIGCIVAATTRRCTTLSWTRTFGIIVLALFAVMTFLVFQYYNAELEYSIVDDTLTIDRIMAKSARKRCGVYTLSRAKLVARADSQDALRMNHMDVKTYDYSVGASNHDSVVIYAYNEHNELVRVFVYPDERILHSIQNVVEKDVFKVIDF